MPKLSGFRIAAAGLALSACASPRAAGVATGDSGYLALTTDQPASFVIGQPSLEAAETGPDFLQNGWGNASIIDGRLFIADTGGHRLWMFDPVPDATRVSPDVVLGDPSQSSATAAPFAWPLAIQRHEGKYYVADCFQGVISVWGELPVGARDYADAALITDLGHPEGLTIVDGAMVVSYAKKSVRIWRTVPGGGTADDGSPVVLTRAGGVPFVDAYRHWTDGRKLLVADSGNHRVLGWNNLPERNDQEPDFVLGQREPGCGGRCDPGTTRVTLRQPYAVTSNGEQIFVRDNGNNRVLVWNAFPARNGAPADVVLGQPDFTSGGCNRGGGREGRPSATTLCDGYGILYGDRKLFVADEPGNGAARWLVFTARRPRPGAGD